MQRHRNFAWFFAMIALFFSAAFRFAPITAEGKQCPTAPVRVVVEMRTIRTCHGDEIAVPMGRQVRPGDAGFHQCRCAEKSVKSVLAAALDAPALVSVGVSGEFSLPVSPLLPAVYPLAMLNPRVSAPPRVPPPC